MTSENRFVCVINRNRDGYQVPLALEEAGLLSSFVTDFYAPDKPPRWLPDILKARHANGLPARQTRSTWSSFAMQAVMVALKLPTRRILWISDRILANRALGFAKRECAHLYCYASYVPLSGQMPAATRMIDFEFHPLPQLTIDTLRADAEKYAEVAQSFAREEGALKEEVVTDSWRRAEAVVCASDMTRRSLEYVGCPAERITVVPYGFRDRTALPPAKTRQQGACRFLFVGQGIQRKGLHHLIRAWRAANLENCTLTLVCYQIDPGIADMIEGTGIELLGRQSRSELEALYDAADVFVMPSLVEGFGLVYLEAIERGCHVIGTYNTGLPDLPLGDNAVSLVAAGDIDALAVALAELDRRKRAGGLDAPAIQREIDKWTWRDFRNRISEHARRFLERDAAPIGEL